ncbi:MAG TPA: coproporphyrinogen-III oxidase family protein [Streptosporangiaceae bacterium]
MTATMRKVRQTPHTYPFNYARAAEDDFFSMPHGALYVHVPFCRHKCHFCDFTVYINKDDDVREAYVRRLCEEISRFAGNRAFPAFAIDAIYIGGGTPGMLSGGQLARIVRTCKDAYDVTPECEISVEFDPPAVLPDKVAEVVDSGVSRISVGAQSFDDGVLRHSNRAHDAADVFAAFETLAASGVRKSNIDLIYPLPGLTMDVWQDSVAKAMSLNPASVSLYGLEVWPGTAYHSWLKAGKMELPTPETEVAMYLYAADTLEAAGFVAHSTNGYVRPDRAEKYCRYLDFYWNHWPTIGFGVSSRSAVHDRVWANVKGLKEYTARIEAGRSALELGRRLSKPEEMRRVVIRGIKTCRLSKRQFADRFGVGLETIFPKEIASLTDDGLIDNTPDELVLTRQGRALSTNVFARFYRPEDNEPLADGEVSVGRSALVE